MDGKRERPGTGVSTLTSITLVDRLLLGLVAALTLEATVAQPSIRFVNLYKSNNCNYNGNSNSITLANPQAGIYTDVIFSQVG
jgi:hypothetical protein